MTNEQKPMHAKPPIFIKELKYQIENKIGMMVSFTSNTHPPSWGDTGISISILCVVLLVLVIGHLLLFLFGCMSVHIPTNKNPYRAFELQPIDKVKDGTHMFCTRAYECIHIYLITDFNCFTICPQKSDTVGTVDLCVLANKHVA